MASHRYCINGKECMEDRWESPTIKREKEEAFIVDNKNLNALIHNAAAIIVVASVVAAANGLDDLAETLYNTACGLYDDAFTMIPE